MKHLIERCSYAAIILAGLMSGPALGQTAPGAGEPGTSPVLRITVDDAVNLAVEHNAGLAADRLDPQIGDTEVAQAASAFTPSVFTAFNRNGQLSPPSSFLVSTGGTRTDGVASTMGLAQRLPWGGGSYAAGWTGSRIVSNSFLQNFNPTLTSGVNLSISQPLLRDFTIDPARQQLISTRYNRDISDMQYRESSIHLLADVKRAYWDLVSARANEELQQRSLELSQELARVNQARVNVGQAPPIDLLSAQAEVAQREESVIVADALAKQVQDRLRTLILAPDRADLWQVRLEPIDTPPPVAPQPDIDAAVQHALRDRADLRRSRTEIQDASTSVKFYGNQRLPDVRLNANYQTTGLGGTHLLRVGGFPGTLVPGGDTTEFGTVLNQVIKGDFPTWTVGLSISYPIGRSYDEAGLARARLQQSQAQQRLKDLELNVVRQVRQTALQLEMNAKRVQATRLTRELNEQRLDVEQKRFDVGMSTSFLVIQAQRDLAQARNNELLAQLAYDGSLIDFEAIQLAGPEGGSQGGQSGGQVVAITPPQITTTSTTTIITTGQTQGQAR